MTSLELFLIKLERWPWSAIYRVALGFVFGALSGSYDRVSIHLALFIGLLVALRVIPMVLRRVLPFSAEAKQIWAERRNIAKRHDSYQWQKLFWIGLGQVLHAVIGDGPRNGEHVVTLICMIGGSAGLLFWNRVRADSIKNGRAKSGCRRSAFSLSRLSRGPLAD
jgi:UDP-N-acetylmuramyl pentapeptide phosphotransferase/UDP-N-acetylglucosamine-1-phosphate transferase